MSFFPRMIVGGTTFIVVVAGAFYIYYKTRYIFDDKTSDDEAGEKNVSKNEDLTGKCQRHTGIDNLSSFRTKVMVNFVVQSQCYTPSSSVALHC